MAHINAGRMTARPEGTYVVFLIGMRINNVFAVHRWVPVILAMSKMLKELHEHPELGFRSFQSWFARTTILVQYWDSSENLMAYAKATDSAHLPAWRAFNRVAKSPAVGIWHETYVIDPGKSENIYVNMPTFGFGKVGELQPVKGKLNSAQERLSQQQD